MRGYVNLLWPPNYNVLRMLNMQAYNCFVDEKHCVSMCEAGWSSSSSQGSNWARSRVIVNGILVKFGETFSRREVAIPSQAS